MGGGRDQFDRADGRGQFVHAWGKARQVELLAALGDRDRYLRAAARLADWEGPFRPEPYDVAMALGMMPNELVSPDRLVELARQGRRPATRPSMAKDRRWAWPSTAAGAIARRRSPGDAGRRLITSRRRSWRWRSGGSARRTRPASRSPWPMAPSNPGAASVRAAGVRSWSWWFDGPRLVALRREAMR